MRISDEKIVVKMYQNHKLSMRQIADYFRVSPSVIQRILDRNFISRRSISEAIHNINITQFNKKPFRQKQHLSPIENDLKITGVMLYWGEGAKTGNVVNFSNSNPEMIVVFLRFLREVCGVDKERIKILIHMYPDHNSDTLQSFWSSVSGISRNNFYRPHIHDGKPGTYKNKSVYGTASISYCDTKLLKLILVWIEEYKNIFLGILPP